MSLSSVQSGGAVLRPGTGQRLKGKSFAGEAVQAGRQDCFVFRQVRGVSFLRMCPSGAHIYSTGKRRIYSHGNRQLLDGSIGARTGD
jgi:hypothetical protein